MIAGVQRLKPLVQVPHHGELVTWEQPTRDGGISFVFESSMSYVGPWRRCAGDALCELLRARLRTPSSRLRLLDIGVDDGLLLLLSKLCFGERVAAHGIAPRLHDVEASARNLKRYGVDADIRLGCLRDHIAEMGPFDVVTGSLLFRPHPQDAVDEPGGSPLDAGASILPLTNIGGPDGRRLFDEVIRGSRRLLAPGGTILLTHSTYLSVDKSADILRRRGFLNPRVVKQSEPIPFRGPRYDVLLPSGQSLGRSIETHADGDVDISASGEKTFRAVSIAARRPMPAPGARALGARVRWSSWAAAHIDPETRASIERQLQTPARCSDALFGGVGALVLSGSRGLLFPIPSVGHPALKAVGVCYADFATARLAPPSNLPFRSPRVPPARILVSGGALATAPRPLGRGFLPLSEARGEHELAAVLRARGISTPPSCGYALLDGVSPLAGQQAAVKLLAIRDPLDLRADEGVRRRFERLWRQARASELAQELRAFADGYGVQLARFHRVATHASPGLFNVAGSREEDWRWLDVGDATLNDEMDDPELEIRRGYDLTLAISSLHIVVGPFVHRLRGSGVAVDPVSVFVRGYAREAGVPESVATTFRPGFIRWAHFDLTGVFFGAATDPTWRARSPDLDLVRRRALAEDASRPAAPSDSACVRFVDAATCAAARDGSTDVLYGYLPQEPKGLRPAIVSVLRGVLKSPTPRRVRLELPPAVMPIVAGWDTRELVARAMAGTRSAPLFERDAHEIRVELAASATGCVDIGGPPT